MDPTPFLSLVPAPRILFDHAAARADRVRYRVLQADGSWHTVTWAQHAANVRAAACGLAALGLQPGERAALFAPNSVQWMEAALAIEAVRATMVPVYASNTADQLAYVIGHCEARVVFVDTAALLAKLVRAWPQVHSHVRQVVWLGVPLAPAAAQELNGRIIHWSDLLTTGHAGDAAHSGAFDATLAALSLDDVGVMLYTSGTSGPPKGVPLTHGQVAHNGRDWLTCNAPLVEEGDVDLLWLPMSHIFGYGEACLGNTLGFESWLVDPLQALARLPEVRPQVFMGVPAVWEKLAGLAAAADQPAERLRELTGGRLRFCLSGGAGLKRSVKEQFLAAGLLIVEGYGLTECAPTLTLNRSDSFRFDSVGRPLPSVELRLDDDGEILARGPNVFHGYHRDDAATAAAFTPDGWFRTGDVGRWTEDGFLQIIDRKKDIFVSTGGKNIPPANIELQFANDPLLAHVVLFGDARPCLVAGVWLAEAAVQQVRAESVGRDLATVLRARVQARIDAVNSGLARHETIRAFAILDRPLTIEGGLLTPTLKVRRKAVHAAFRAEFEALYSAPVAQAQP